ncbi:MAG TPA: CPBP family intramembrane glutamic endopeptidase [Caulobacteraceae bacterium]|nr:CPBP family intramembrane glutamic endopeptidase [Caulobacteraceae bacterium]
MSKLIKQTGVFGLAAAVALAITVCGQTVWGVLAIVNLKLDPAVPWAAGVMAAILAGLLLFLGGRIGPKGSAAARKRLLRWNPVKPRVFAFAVFAGVLGLGALGGAWIALSDVVRIPPGLTPSTHGIPIWTGILFLITASLAAPLTEEAAFRGYAMGMLEKSWGPIGAIVGSTVLFAAVHINQGADIAKLSLYFSGGLIFAGVAYLTNSLYPAMIVHSLGDVMGFTLLWPHDAPHRLVTEGGHDPLFVPAVAALVVFLPLALLAFRHLARMTRGATGRNSPVRLMAVAA